MKKISIILFALVLIQCDVIDKLTHFNIDNETTFTIPSTTLINSPLSINTPEVTTNSNQEFDNNSTNSELVESIKLTSLRLSINSPNNGNFNFLKSVRIFINADGLEEIEMAYVEGLEDDNLTELSLTSVGVELRDYVKKDSYTLRVETVTD